MGLWNAIQTAIYGVDPAEEQARNDALNAQIAQQNQALLERGVWTQTQYDAAQTNLVQSNIDVQGEINQAAKEGAIQGLKDLQQGVKSTLAETISGVFGAIPWQLWIVGGVALFVWMGGLTLLRGKLAK